MYVIFQCIEINGIKISWLRKETKFFAVLECKSYFKLMIRLIPRLSLSLKVYLDFFFFGIFLVYAYVAVFYYLVMRRTPQFVFSSLILVYKLP